MNTPRRMYTVIKRRGKMIWRSIKKNVMTCVRGDSSSDSTTDEIFENVLDALDEEMQYRKETKGVRLQAKELLPAEEMPTSKTLEEGLTENSTTLNCCEPEGIETNSNSGLSTVDSTSLITEDVLDVKETETDSLLLPPIANFTSNEEDETSTSNSLAKKPPAGTNSMGKIVYRKSFMLKLESAANCQRKPDCLLNSRWKKITKSSNPLHCSSLKNTASYNLSKPQNVTRYAKHNNGFPRGKMPQRFKKQQPTITKSDNGQENEESKSKFLHTSLSSSYEVELNKTENAWKPTIATKKAGPSTDVSVTDEEINKKVRSILNKITPDNIAVLTERFVALPIDTTKRLENTIDLIFEKAIEEQSFAPFYAAVCSAMQSIQVNSTENKKTTSFRVLIINKCQRLFETDNAQKIDSVKKLAEIDSCKDPEKKNELKLEYEENERRLRKRSVGNCRFIGELFKQNMLTPKILLHCIANLVSQHSEEPLECLCNILRTTGKELEQCCDLNDTFKKLNDLVFNKSESKISTRIRFMIQDIIDLRKDRWIPRRLENKPKTIKEIEEEAKKEEMASSSCKFGKKQPYYNRADNKFGGGDNQGNYNNRNYQTNSKFGKPNNTFNRNKVQGMKDYSSVTSLSPPTSWRSSKFTGGEKRSTTPVAANEMLLKSNDRASGQPSNSKVVPADISKKIVTDNLNVELDSAEVDEKINTLCKSIIEEYEQMHNLDDVIYSLVEDKKSCIRTRHEKFVTSTTLITLNSKPKSRAEAGNMFAELLSKNVLSNTAISRGLDTVLNDWNDHCTDYPHFFSYVADIVAPLLISKTASFKFFDLKKSCASIRPDNSSVFFVEVLQTILCYENTQNVQNDFGGTLRTYNMWREQSKYVPLDVFIPNNQINKYFKNDQLGVLLLSMTIYDKTRLIGDNEPLYDTTNNWIRKNINEEIVKVPDFLRTLIMSTAIVCSNKPKYDPNEDFFNSGHGILLNYYIRSVYAFSACEIREREVQCIKGSQIISTTLREQQNSEDKALRPFYELYRDHAISRVSLDAWKNEEEFNKNSTEPVTFAVLNSLFLEIDNNR